MPSGTAQQIPRSRRQHHGPAAVELVEALMNQPLIRDFLQRGRRKPSTLSSLERRWFVGRLRLETARQKHNSLSKADLYDPLLGCNLELVGTAGLLYMASSVDSNDFVTVRASAMADWYEFVLRVPVRRRGQVPKHRIMSNKAHGSVVMGNKVYYVHAEVVAVTRRYIQAFEKREHARGSPPVSVSPDTCADFLMGAELGLATTALDHRRGIGCSPLTTTDARWLDQPVDIAAADNICMLDRDENGPMSEF